MKLEFLTCGNQNDAFLSQAAIYRLMLDQLGPEYRAARFVLCLGGPRQEPLPERWQPWFERIEIRWADEGDFARLGDHAQSLLCYSLVDPTADLSFGCDADTLLLRPFPEVMLHRAVQSPAVLGCIAHYPPPLADERLNGQQRFADADALWDALAARILGRKLNRPFLYTLTRHPQLVASSCPYYINLGFIAAPPEMLRAVGRAIAELLPEVQEVLDNRFREQLAVPFAIERLGLPCQTLPMRYNFPNDTIAEELYPADAVEPINIHYLRTEVFDRHRVFAEQAEFDRFMRLPLAGSNAILRDAVRDLTGGRYPFR